MSDGTSIHITPEWLSWSSTQALAACFEQAGIDMRFVGGCVRDALLGRTATDVDIATPATPEQVMSLLAAAQIKVIPTGIDHGTVTAVLEGKAFEITTLRKDVACDGRKAEVEFTDDWLEDASRRDLTINALYATAHGHVIDYFHGAEDARAGVVRFIGDANARLREDALRILRFYRFYAWYAKTVPDEQGQEACTQLAHLVKHLSAERISSEMLKLLTAPQPLKALAYMQQAGVLDEIGLLRTEISVVATVVELEKENACAADPIRRLAALLRVDGADHSSKAVQLAGRWKLSNHQKTSLAQRAGLPLTVFSNPREQKKQLRVLGVATVVDMALIAGALDILPHSEVSSLITLSREWQIPEFPLKGKDLIAQGIAPGKSMGEALAELETQWEESDYSLSKKALINLLKPSA